ncbi:MAG: TerB family tellurite resistance protein [Anaerovoracaceae bacterium]
MNEQEKSIYLKALMYIAMADDEVEEDEIQYFQKLGIMYGLKEQQIADLQKSVINREESIESILLGLTERSTKLTLLYDLVALCYADGKYSIVEKTGLQKICEIMGVETTKTTELEEVMKESLELQNRINSILER